MEVSNRYVTIKQAIDGRPSELDFVVMDNPLTLELKESSNEIIVKNLYLSIDPYQLNRMKTNSSSQTALKDASKILPTQAIDAHGVGRVVVSSNPEFKEGDMVVGMFGWEEYSVIQRSNITTKLDFKQFPLSHYLSILGTLINSFNFVDFKQFPLSHYLSILGISGHSAYAGFYEICKPKKGEKVLVSGAYGSVGNIVGQLARLHGCYVVGSAGTNEKVDLLKGKLGFNDAFNYKEETDLNSALQRYFPDGIDIYFDNVGGGMLEAAISNMNNFGRVAACGVISEYTNSGRQRAAPNMIDVIYKRITIRGFLLTDHLHIYSDFVGAMSDHLRSGRIHVLEDISRGIESIPSAFVGLFRGDNTGKKMIELT